MEKTVSTFNLQIELSKVKISIPFNEFLRNREYRDKITGMVRNQWEFQPDILEVNDDAPTIVFWSKIENGDAFLLKYECTWYGCAQCRVRF